MVGGGGVMSGAFVKKLPWSYDFEANVALHIQDSGVKITRCLLNVRFVYDTHLVMA